MKNFFLLACSFLFLGKTQAQSTAPGTVKSFTEVSRRSGSLGTSFDFYEVGIATTSFSDLDGDSVRELAFRAQDFAGGVKAIHLYRISSNGTLKPNPVKLSTANSLLSTVATKYSPYNANFVAGAALTTLKDLNGNGVDELVASLNNTGGGFLVLFMNAAGTIDSLTLVNELYGGFNAPSNGAPGFGRSLSRIGDVDNDGIDDLAVGSPGSSASDRGAVYIFFMKSNGTVRSQTLIGNNAGGLGPLPVSALFGLAVTRIGDLDKDGVPDIMVGSQLGTNSARGAIRILFLNSNGSVKSSQLIEPSATSILDTVNVGANFGYALANIGDLDGDSVTDVATSAYSYRDSIGGTFGRVYVMFMNTNGTVKARQFIDRYYGNFTAPSDTFARFGSSLAGFGDINKDGIPDLAVGARDVTVAGNTTGVPSGAIYLMNLNGVPVQTGVGDLLHNFSQHYFLYPNPASDHICIRARKPVNASVRVQLLDASGRVVASSAGLDGATSEINVAILPPGTYTVAIESGSEVEYGRFVKQ